MAEPRKLTFDLMNIRERARQSLERGAITENYTGSVEQTIELLNEALATELVCVLRYRFHAVAAVGINSEGVREEFATHADEELEHVGLLAERIDQLGGKPNYSPIGLAERSATEYVEGETLIDMIREDLVAERIAIETYREMIRHFANHDPTTRRMLEIILAKEEEHAQDMHELLVAHEGEPMLDH